MHGFWARPSDLSSCSICWASAISGEAQILLGDITARVVRKPIKHIHLRIIEPQNEVRISVPERMPIETAQALAMTKFDWLSQRLSVLREQHAQLAMQPMESECCYVWGRRYAIVALTADTRSVARIDGDRVIITQRPGATVEDRRAILEQWYRTQLAERLPSLLAMWEAHMGVRVGRICFQRMKTRWGSSNNATRTIRINIMMAEKPPELLEYLLVHEMTHFFHNGHGAGFQAAMDHWLPQWRTLRHQLDIFPRS